MLPPRLSIDTMVMGRDLECSRPQIAGDDFSLANGTDWARLTPKEERAALAVAQKGLEALKAIARESPRLAAMLGMGGSFMRLLLRGFLSSLLEAEKHQELADVDNPRFAVEVGSLYQLVLAYFDDRMEPVYPSEFHPPGKRVEAGSRTEVFKNLKRLADDLNRE